MLPTPSIEVRDAKHHRRFRIIIGAMVLFVVVLLALQYTGHGVLPARKTSTLWGFLVGLAGTWIYNEYQLSPRRRD